MSRRIERLKQGAAIGATGAASVVVVDGALSRIPALNRSLLGRLAFRVAAGAAATFAADQADAPEVIATAVGAGPVLIALLDLGATLAGIGPLVCAPAAPLPLPCPPPVACPPPVVCPPPVQVPVTPPAPPAPPAPPPIQEPVPQQLQIEQKPVAVPPQATPAPQMVMPRFSEVALPPVRPTLEIKAPEMIAPGFAANALKLQVPG